MKKLVKESLNEKLAEKYTEEISVKVRKGSAENLIKILECIKGCGNIGHSFEVVVDPDEKENLSERTFGWDGDGSDYIDEIKLVK
jgi:predicted house-cleaning noncanonical NTP pyrophosphatase (MazG superfamily)